MTKDQEIADRRHHWLKATTSPLTKEKGMTIREFVEAINFNLPELERTELNTAYRWFQGGRSPQRFQLAKILRVFKNFPVD